MQGNSRPAHRQSVRGLISAILVLVAVVLQPMAARARSQAAQPGYVLITDVDDTIKVSHVVDTVSKVIRFLSDPVSFAGMSTLYTRMMDAAKARGQRSSFIVLSGTPTLFESSLWDFLELFKFPEPFRVITRPMLLNTEEYKTEAVTRVISHPTMRDATVILVGDDTQSDFAAYRNSVNTTGATASQQSQIYIRRVTGNASVLVKTAPRALAFDSAADIAMWEFGQGRLSRAAVEEVFTEIENEKDFQRLFVPEEYCPGTRDPRLSTTLKATMVPIDLLDRLTKLEDHLRTRCTGLNAWVSGVLE